ncbi:probable amidase At4g34880, partial [Papaver somniferum]|uniref:probable amidase At4g34880 n=1 Tax=Papaver somniferum TaxID=3469 RepID=UPI000E6F9122
QAGAVIVDKLAITNINTILNPALSGETQVEKFELKVALNAYLGELVSSPVRSLAEVISFNTKNPSLEKTTTYGQDFFIGAQKTSGNIGAAEKKVYEKLKKLDDDGFVSLMNKNNLFAVVTPGSRFSTVLAIGGHPGINVPAGFQPNGMPIGITFGGLRGSEPKLIEISYAFEQLTLARKPPSYEMLTKTLNTIANQDGITSSDSLIEMII